MPSDEQNGHADDDVIQRVEGHSITRVLRLGAEIIGAITVIVVAAIAVAAEYRRSSAPNRPESEYAHVRNLDLVVVAFGHPRADEMREDRGVAR